MTPSGDAVVLCISLKFWFINGDVIFTTPPKKWTEKRELMKDIGISKASPEIVENVFGVSCFV